jgi:phosphatidylglycerophosphatase A
MAALARLIAGGFGVGHVPRAPGTAGSLAAVLLGGLLLAWWPAALLVAAVAATLFGGAAIAAARLDGDPGWVVIDEVAGQWIALLPLAHAGWRWATGWPWLLAGFALFRLFDITKPGPAGWADRQHGALAIMADDTIAGLLAAGLLWLGRRVLDG